MSRLDEILEVKRAEIERLRPHAEELRRAAWLRDDFRSLRAALDRGPESLALIAEVKKASPSAGVIAESFAPTEIAQNYARAGAEAVSVLTDQQFFGGDIEFLQPIRESIALPILRKDFMLDELQIIEAAAGGADAILLIVAALADDALRRLADCAQTYQLDALVEVHTLAELERALEIDARIIGINNRNLATFEVDLAVTERLSEEVPDEIVLVSESGIRTAEDVARVRACGANAVLIGEALMRGGAPAIASLLGRSAY